MINADRPPRGFVTIATGSLHYYKLASNLLHSYRRNGGGEYPFAIIAEEKNEYTKEFDQIILLSEADHSYMDKLRLFDCLPYEETIFIDADCLVYGKIDDWWDYFSDSSDVSCFGYAYEDLSTKRGWFLYDGMGEFKDRISFIPSFSGGIYFVRNTNTAAQVFEYAKYAATHYGEYPFAIFENPADEPVLAFGMAVCNCRPIDLAEVGIYVRRSEVELDILRPSARWIGRGKAHAVKLIHWGNFGTMKAQYLLEVEKLNRSLAGKPMSSFGTKLLYGTGLRYSLLLWHDGATLLKRIRRRVKLFLNKQKSRAKI